MTKKQWIANGLLLLTAIIWGFAFVSQKVGGERIGPYAFTGIRFLMGSAVLWPVIAFADRRNPPSAEAKRLAYTKGLMAGGILGAASILQQLGIGLTQAGKAGFLTALYVVLVPVIGFVFLRQRFRWPIAAAMLLAAAGLYLLSVTERFTIQRGDTLVLVSALLFALHILFVDRWAGKVEPLRMSSVQFFVTGVMGLLLMLPNETLTADAIRDGLPALLYSGIMSVGVAFTLQVIAQKDAKPAHAAILMSLESVFSVIGGALLLNERMGLRSIIGCMLMFAAVLLAQKE